MDGLYEIDIDGCHIKLKIKLIRGTGGMYLPISNCTQKNGSFTVHLQSEAHYAVEDTLRGLLLAYNPKRINKDDDFILNDTF